MGFTQLFSLIKGSSFIWKLLSNWKILKDSLTVISDTLKKMHDEGRDLPETSEASQMLLALSNIIKTQVIDIPGVDEYEISIGIDKINTAFMLSIEDAKSSKYHQIIVSKGK